MGYKSSGKRVREAQKATGLSADQINNIARQLGIKNFNSKDERKRVVARARENQVQSAYKDVLGRDPDQGGQQHYINQLSEGRNITDIRNEMYGSDEYKSNISAATSEAEDRATQAEQKYDDLRGTYDDLRGTYDDQISGYQNRIQGLEDSLSGIRTDYEGQLNRFKSEMEQGIAKYKGLYDTEVTGRADDRAAAQQRYEAQEKDFMEQLNAQARAEAAEQLRGLRAGSTASATARPMGAVGLASGQTTASRQEKGAVMDVRPEVNATDSVLDRSGPVVQLISNIRARRPSGGGGGGSSPLAGGGAGNYYASRFG